MTGVHGLESKLGLGAVRVNRELKVPVEDAIRYSPLSYQAEAPTVRLRRWETVVSVEVEHVLDQVVPLVAYPGRLPRPLTLCVDVECERHLSTRRDRRGRLHVEDSAPIYSLEVARRDEESERQA